MTGKESLLLAYWLVAVMVAAGVMYSWIKRERWSYMFWFLFVGLILEAGALGSFIGYTVYVLYTSQTKLEIWAGVFFAVIIAVMSGGLLLTVRMMREVLRMIADIS